MPSIQEIAKHVVTGQEYSKNSQATNSQDSKVYQTLLTATTKVIVERIKEYVKGNVSFKEMEQEIRAENAYEYLAAAKVIDLATCSSEMAQTTFKIRVLCVLASQKSIERNEINLLNAFSNPSLDMDNDDPFLAKLLANELDNSHPGVVKAAFGAERDKLLNLLYTLAQNRVQIMPEVIPIIEKIISYRCGIIKQVASSLPERTAVVFKGPSGAGKSYAINEFTQHIAHDILVDQVVQSSDNIKKDIRDAFLEYSGKAFALPQIHLLSHAIFKMMSQEMKVEYPSLSTLQEGWFNGTDVLKNLFKEVQSTNLSLRMKDFDGDFEALCLRVLSRHDNKDTPKPPFAQVVRGFKTCRESRPLVMASLRPEDRYELRFVSRDGTIEDAKDPATIPTNVDKEIEATQNMIIREEHVRIFGESLLPFVGLSVIDSFKKAEGMLA